MCAEWPGEFSRIDPGLEAGTAGLAVDTSGRRPLVALVDPGGSVHSFVGDSTRGPQHGRYIVPIIRELLNRSGVETDGLTFVAAALGPGSFTGLRIGLTAAKMLAYAWCKPLVGVDSLDVIAASLQTPPPVFHVATDAQRGDAFVAPFRSENPLPSRFGPTLIQPWAAWSVGLDTDAGIVTPPSSPWAASPDDLESRVLLQGPSATGLLRLARAAWTERGPSNPWFLEPTYLRPSAAEEKAPGAARAPEPQDTPNPS